MNEWTVWVGGTEMNDHLLTRDQAERLAQEWREDGYTDVVVERPACPVCDETWCDGTCEQ